MPKLYFSHTITREKSYQQKLPSQKQWFEEHDFPVFLPEKIDNASLNKNAATVNKKLPDLHKKGGLKLKMSILLSFKALNTLNFYPGISVMFLCMDQRESFKLLICY